MNLEEYFKNHTRAEDAIRRLDEISGRHSAVDLSTLATKIDLPTLEINDFLDRYPDPLRNSALAMIDLPMLHTSGMADATASLEVLNASENLLKQFRELESIVRDQQISFGLPQSIERIDQEITRVQELSGIGLLERICDSYLSVRLTDHREALRSIRANQK